jgi:hypothetical protein
VGGGVGLIMQGPTPFILSRAFVPQSKRPVVVPNLEVELMDEGHQRVVELITGGDLVQGASLRGLAEYDAARGTLTYTNQSLVTSSTILNQQVKRSTS